MIAHLDDTLDKNSSDLLDKISQACHIVGFGKRPKNALEFLKHELEDENPYAQVLMANYILLHEDCNFENFSKSFQLLNMALNSGNRGVRADAIEGLNLLNFNIEIDLDMENTGLDGTFNNANQNLTTETEAESPLEQLSREVKKRLVNELNTKPIVESTAEPEV